MTIKSWFQLFCSTLFIGTAASLAAGLILVMVFKDFTLMELSEPGVNWQTLLFIVLSGSTISVLSHMGFFSYLILRFIALGFLRSKKLWDWVQLLLLIVCMIDFIYLRYVSFGGGTEDYLLLPVAVLLISIGIAYWKMRLTNRDAFIPTLFFMYVVTVLEAIPALRLDGVSSSLYMMVPLLASNAWQILRLHIVLEKNKKRLAS